MFGLETYTDDGRKAVAKKPTMWMSNSPLLLKELTVRCDGLHAHQHLTENRANACENYPLDLVHAILRGIAATMDARRAMNGMQENQWNVLLNLQMNDPVTYDEPDHPAQIEPSVLLGDDGCHDGLD